MIDARKICIDITLVADLLAKMCCLRNFFEPDPDLGTSFSFFSNQNSRYSKYRYQSWKCLSL